MKKFKFFLWACVFMIAMYLPIPFALAWGYKAIPICIICAYTMWKVVAIMMTYHD